MRRASPGRLKLLAALLGLGFVPWAAAGPPPPAKAPPLPEGAWRVEWLAHDAPSVWTAGDSRSVTVRLRHAGVSDTPWPDRRNASPDAGGDHAVRLGCRWQCGNPERGVATPDDDARAGCRTARADLAAPLARGESATLTLDVVAPRTPGACQLTFDLVQENVAWFSARGGRTLSLPVQLAPATGGAAPPPWGHAVRTLALALGGLALLVVAGLAPAWALRSRRNASWLPLAVPAVGLGTLSAVGHALAYLPRGTDWSAGPTLAVLALLGGLAWRGRARVPRAHRGAWLAAGAALALGAWPVIEVGELTTLGRTIDAIPYVAGAERLQHMGMARAPRPALEDPIVNLGRDFIATGLRQGDQFVLATCASLTGLRPHRVFSIVMALWGVLATLGIFAFARRALGARPAAATLAALFAALHPLGHYVRLSDYFSQAAGLALFPFAALALWEAPRERSWRGLVLAGLLLGTLVTLYPIYLVYLAPLALAALVAAGRRPRWRGVARMTGMAIAALALFPYGWRLAARALPYTLFVARGGLGDVSVQGSMSAFAAPGVVFGLANPLGLERPATPPTHPVVALLLGAALLLVALAVAEARPRARAAALALLATLVAGAAHQRLALQFPYGYYKILALHAPLLAALVALGLAAGWRRARAWSAPRAWALWGAVAALALAFAAVFVRQGQAAGQEFVGPRLVADHAQLELEQARALVPDGAPLLWLDTRWPGRAWSLYLLGHTLNYDRDEPVAYAAAREDESPRLVRHALLAHQAARGAPHAGEPWWDPSRHEVLWSNERFRLLRRRDGAVAELRFVHPRARLSLRAPLVVELARGELRLVGRDVAGGSISQRLEWPADALEVAFEASRQTRLWTRRDGASLTQTHVLDAGERALGLPAAPRIELGTDPDAEVFVLGVKAVAGTR